MDQDFSKWLLSQIKDPVLVDRMKARMEEKEILEVSGVAGSDIRASGMKEGARLQERESRMRQIRRGHEYQPDGFWLNRLYSGPPMDEARARWIFQEMGPEPDLWIQGKRLEEEEREVRMAREGGEAMRTWAEGLYEHLANFANGLAFTWSPRFAGQSGEEEARFQGVFLSSALLRRLATYARDRVEAHFSPDREEDDSLSLPKDLRSLQGAFGHQGLEDLVLLADALVEEIPPAGPREYLAMGYTETGIRKTWWDPEGKIQAQGNYSPLQIRRFDHEPLKKTFVWTAPPLAERILALYDRVCDVLREALEDDSIRWRSLAMKTYLYSSVTGKKVDNPNNYTLLSNIFRLSEDRVRALIPGLPALAIGEDLQNLERRLPLTVRKAVLATIETYQIPPLSGEEMAGMIHLSRYGVKMAEVWGQEGADPLVRKREIINKLSPEDAFTLLQRWSTDDLDLESLRLILMAVKREGEGKEPSPAQARKRARLMDPSWEGTYLEMVRTLSQAGLLSTKKEGPPRSTDLQTLYDRLMEDPGLAQGLGPEEEEIRAGLVRQGAWADLLMAILAGFRTPKARTLTLNRSAIRASREKLADTVDFLGRFLDEEDQDAEGPPEGEEVSEAEEAEEAPPTPKEAFGRPLDTWAEALLEALVENEDFALPMDRAQALVGGPDEPLAPVLGTINDAFYDDIGAQLVEVDGDRVVMDPYDGEWLRSLRKEDAHE
ncbi:tellurite resistance TerB C-terminal domain-containing protein [Kallipyga massiliensis]|uniref:tellurite resistance TerB C-terminal domain-containing protein n=1 Tax=Kallipyga massiliensis TaxID=1472764 RepID=UPI0004B9A918|nr:tellurite resistance TerB C-terminal domain-containing protein [Kallipyga massiliensis]